jgi:hypothetical protein
MQCRYRANLFQFLLPIVLSSAFISYSFQHYIPPSKLNSISYSILNCPSHTNQNSLSYIIDYMTRSEGDEENEKLCLCFSCCNHRFPFVIFKPLINLSIDEYIISLFPSGENAYLKEPYTNLSTRSPPGFIA